MTTRTKLPFIASAPSGTSGFPAEPANTVFAGPTTGPPASPTFRGLVSADIPSGTVLLNQIGNPNANTNINAGTFQFSYNVTANSIPVFFGNTTPGSPTSQNDSPYFTFNSNGWNGTVSAGNQWAILMKTLTGTNAPSLLFLDFQAGPAATFGITTNSQFFQFQLATSSIDFGINTSGWTLQFTDGTVASLRGSIVFSSTGIGSFQVNAGAGAPQLQLNGALTTGNAAAVKLSNSSNLTGTLNQSLINMVGTFSPTSGAATFWGNRMQLTINQAGSTGSYQALAIQVTETALGGTANEMIICSGGAGGATRVFDVDNHGAHRNGQFTVAALPAGSEGQILYATNGRKVGEGPGAGTGVPVYFSNGLWRVFSTDAQVLA